MPPSEVSLIPYHIIGTSNQKNLCLTKQTTLISRMTLTPKNQKTKNGIAIHII